MARGVDLIGQKFARLTVISKFGQKKNNSILWNCICECGNTKIVTTSALRQKTRPTRSCGCLKIETNGQATRLLVKHM
jgi:hypothetical protein